MPPPFVPDVPYKIQFIFLCSFSYIWSTAFIDDYLEPMPGNPDERIKVLVRRNYSL